MVYPVTTLGDSSSSIGALGFDAKAFLIQLATFILAYLVLQRYAFKPILKVMRERRETIENGVKLGEQLKQEQAKLEAKVDEELHKARKQADEIIAGAEETGRQAVREAEEKARDKAAVILKEAESRVAQDMTRARRQLEKEVVNLVSEATETIIGEKVDARKDAGLIERALEEARS